MSSAWLLTLIYLAFISLGLPDGVVGVAWPAMRLSLAQPLEAGGLITLVVTGCSALSGFASGWVLRRVSAGVVVTVSGWLTGLALAGLVLLGLGCAPIYPALMHEAAQRFDAATAQRVIGWQVGSGYIGCMVVPVALGLVGAHAGVGLIMPLIALLVVALRVCSRCLDRMT